MSLKVHENGFVEITSKKDAIEALEAAHNLQVELDDLKEEHGISDLEKDIVAYKAALRDFMVRSNIDHIPGDGFHGTLVKSAGSSRWITDKSDLTGNEPDRVMTLRKCIEKKFGEKITKKGSQAREVWQKITRRVADPEKIEEAVNEGLIDVDDISPAWMEVTRAPYLRIFSDAS
jgi:hypothetical protein